ncbi:hypothetical protein BDP27DRAFT_1370194 [Rhodocollybia butyracea]|uniref:Uncharacterized protein n=1 Tax=Rhodocollybia butyracea TaxID=206335 RepID=A0A9P5P8D3_9AGAR|nr:hypothetical protein BDP27DRAFT_1370194 [Rhodocollybia butyracea]
MADDDFPVQRFPPHTPYAPSSGSYMPYTPSPSGQTGGSSPYTPSSAPILPYHSTESPPAVSGSPTSFDTTPIVKPLFIDNLALEHKLTENQRKKLHVMAKFAAVDGGITKPDLLVKLYEMSIHFEMYNNPKIVEDQNNTETLRRMLRDLQIRLEQTFALTPNQNKTVRAIVQDLIYDPLRTCYQDLSADTFDDIKKNATQYGFDNIFGVPAYEKVLERVTIKQSSSVQNGLRQHLHDGMGKGLSVVKFTSHMNRIYLRAGGPAYNRELIVNRNILLRHFIHQNPNAVWVDEEGEPDNDDEFSQPAAGMKKRKIKPATAGRVPKGQDFWSVLDKWFLEKLETLGKKMTDMKWKEFINECRRLDEAGFDSSALQEMPMSTSAVGAQTSSPTNGASPTTACIADQRMDSLLDYA